MYMLPCLSIFLAYRYFTSHHPSNLLQPAVWSWAYHFYVILFIHDESVKLLFRTHSLWSGKFGSPVTIIHHIFQSYVSLSDPIDQMRQPVTKKNVFFGGVWYPEYWSDSHIKLCAFWYCCWVVIRVVLVSVISCSTYYFSFFLPDFV